MIKLSKISKTYDNGVSALAHVTFEVDRGQVVYILGESGSGKSTLLKIMAGLEDADKGEVRVDDEEITGPSQNLVPGYDNLAYVPQDFKLQQFWTVGDNIGKKISHYPVEDKHDRIDELLQLCKLQEYADRYPRELSGGQQQRVAMAAAVSDEPDVVLLDEPFSNLDLPMKAEVRKEIIGMLRDLGITVILVSHDPAEALGVADRILILNKGKLEQHGSPVEVYQKPKSLYAAKFLGPINEITIGKKKQLVRPEDLIIESKGDLEAEVVESIFMGMHYHVFATINNHTLPSLIYSSQNIKSKTAIRLSFKK